MEWGSEKKGCVRGFIASQRKETSCEPDNGAVALMTIGEVGVAEQLTQLVCCVSEKVSR